MSVAYVRKQYGVPAKIGAKVRVRVAGKERDGIITRCTHYVYVRVEGRNWSRPYHPDDVTYCAALGAGEG